MHGADPTGSHRARPRCDRVQLTPLLHRRDPTAVCRQRLGVAPATIPAVPQVPDPIVFSLPADIDPAAILDAVGQRVDVVAGSVSSADRVYLDTFDGRLRAAGMTLSRT